MEDAPAKVLTTPADEGRIDVEPEPRGEQAPDGVHDAVLVDYYTLPDVLHHARITTCVRLVWQLAARNTKGYRFLASRRFTKRLTHGSALRLCLEQWRGAAFDKAQLTTVYLESYIGKPARLTLVHRPTALGVPWVHVARVDPWDWSCRRQPLTPESYLRRHQRTLLGRR